MFGLKPSGFRRKQYDEIIEGLENNARALFGENVNLTESSPLGMILKLYAWSSNILWQLAEKVYFSAFVGTAEGVSLDRVAKYIGISRIPASFAEGLIRFNGEEGTLIPEGTLVETQNGIQYTTLEDGTIDSSAFVRVNSRALDIGADGSVGEAMLTILVNPIVGVTSVTNESAILGRNVETDAEFRLRYTRSVAKTGSSTSASIEATLLQVAGVTDAKVRENDTINEVAGIPAKSIAPIVNGGDDEDIARAILETKSAGIQSFGSELILIEDSRGIEFFIGFSRPIPINISVAITLTTDATFPDDGEDKIEQAIKEYVDELSVGDDVIYTKLISLAHVVRGVTNVVLAVNTGTDNISIDDTEIANFIEVVFS